MDQERLAVKKEGDGKTLAKEVEREQTEKERCKVYVDSEGVVTECTGGMRCNCGSIAPAVPTIEIGRQLLGVLSVLLWHTASN